MRVRAETVLVGAMALFAFTGWLAVTLLEQSRPPVGIVQPRVAPVTVPPSVPDPAPLSGAAWFGQIRGFCNPVDVVTRVRWQPAPDNPDGWMHEAACYALAGKIDLARASIEKLPPSDRYRAAGVVFNAGHPAADAGDELAAGPLMELVVEFWPNHYMALYHAGAAAYERGEPGLAKDYLTRFLENYSVQDGWTSSAVSMLESIAG